MFGAVSRMVSHNMQQPVKQSSCLTVVAGHQYRQQQTVARAFRQRRIRLVVNNNIAPAQGFHASGFPVVILGADQRIPGGLGSPGRGNASHIRRQV